MEKTLTYGERLRTAREQCGPHNVMAVEIGISSDTLQRIISGTEPKQARIITLIDKFLADKDL